VAELEALDEAELPDEAEVPDGDLDRTAVVVRLCWELNQAWN
jgi:hypothetical protein